MTTNQSFMLAGKRVFVAEFDDDYQAAASLTPVELQRRTRCYLLLSPSLVVHPAYLWQSGLTQSYFRSQLQEALKPPFATFALGDSPSLQGYMATRMENLSIASGRSPNNELQQYRHWGRHLEKQAAQLDAAFHGQQQASFTMSRDVMFRRLILHDLSGSEVAGISLREQIATHGVTNGRSHAADRLVRSLRSFASKAALVSLDTIHAHLARNDAAQLASSPTFSNRLLTLYYRANVDENYVVAGLPAVDPNDPTIHPYDPHIFWQVFGEIFGETIRDSLADNPSTATQSVLLELSRSTPWIKFANQYKDFLLQANNLLQIEATEIARELRLSNGYMRLRVLPRVWREKKFELGAGLVGAATSSIGVAMIAGAPLVGAAAAVIGALASAAGLAYSARPLRTFIDEWNANSIRQLRVFLARELRMIANRGR